MKPASCLALACLVAAPLAAQTERIVPANLAAKNGNGDSRIPLTLNNFRFQQVYDGAAIAPRSCVLADLSFRRADAYSAAFGAITLQGTTVLVGPTTVTPTTMTTTFASNATSTLTTVFSGTWNLPAQPAFTSGTGAFNMTVKFAKPLTYLRSADHLLVEVQVAGSNSNAVNYVVDTASGTPGGTVQAYGSGGTLAGGTYAFGSTAIGALVPGGNAILELSTPGNYAAVGIFGASFQAWGPVKLPLDLTPFGAPGNSLLASLDLTVPIPLAQGTTTWDGVGVLPIPDVPVAYGATLYGQGLIIDPKSNKLAMVLTGGVQMTISSGNTSPFTAIYASTATATTGSYLLSVSFAKYNGLVTRFGGVFP
ncbi:MAG: hypothetical protein R3F30_05925 [Planctomycetota bacterium]